MMAPTWKTDAGFIPPFHFCFLPIDCFERSHSADAPLRRYLLEALSPPLPQRNIEVQVLVSPPEA